MEAKKVDLLSFQKNLNEQFIEIFEAKKEGRLQSAQSMELGLQAEVANFKFFSHHQFFCAVTHITSRNIKGLLCSYLCYNKLLIRFCQRS